MPAGFQSYVLVEFVLGSTSWKYCPQRTITIGADTYLARTLKTGEVVSSVDKSRTNMKVIADSEFPPAQVYNAASPASAMTVYVRLYNWGGYGLTELTWAGRVMGVRWSEEDEVEIDCEPFITSIARNAVVRPYSRGCGHVLYDEYTCKLNPASFQHTAVITAVSGANVTLATVGPYVYAGGIFNWNAGTHTDGRMIEFNVANVLTLFTPAAGLTVGQTATIYPGCDRTTNQCNNFGNLLNYGGFPYRKEDDPFKDGMNIGASNSTSDFVGYNIVPMNDY